MSDISIENHLLYGLRNANIQKWPFPHFYENNVFPADFYKVLQERVAASVDFDAKGTNYNGRQFARSVDIPELGFMRTPEFALSIASVFRPQIQERFKGRERVSFTSELRLVRDGKGYYIGPHTDATWKVVSLLFYLPNRYTFDCQHGTSIYTPKDKTFRCIGGPHHKFEDFERVYTVPFNPNSCFGFFKTDNSFHGVEPIDIDMQRDVLLFNLYDAALSSQNPRLAEKQP